jgi:hypothetical protein
LYNAHMEDLEDGLPKLYSKLSLWTTVTTLVWWNHRRHLAFRTCVATSCYCDHRAASGLLMYPIHKALKPFNVVHYVLKLSMESVAQVIKNKLLKVYNHPVYGDYYYT